MSGTGINGSGGSGGALWLVPRDKVSFVSTMQELISDTIPSDFPRVPEKFKFVPHVTLTSGIDLDGICRGESKVENGDNGAEAEAASVAAQKWLDAMQLPEFKKELDEVVVELDHIEAGDDMFRKLVIEVNKQANLLKLVAACRAAHTTDSHNNGEEGEKEAGKWAETTYAPHMSLLYADLPRDEVQKKIGLVEMQLGWSLGSLFDCCGGTFTMGGSIVLVDTRAPVNEWKPMARRDFPFVAWRMSRNLI